MTFSYTGAEDAQGDASFVMSQHGGEEDFIWSGSRFFSRVRTTTVGLPHDWCLERHTTRHAGSGVSPVDTLSSLRASGKGLQRVGSERVRGVATTHYRIVGTRPPIDIWVDDHDLLRRLRWTHGRAHQTDTMEVYGYGEPVSITVPSHARPCVLIPPGMCVLGRSFKQPVCDKVTSTTSTR